MTDYVVSQGSVEVVLGESESEKCFSVQIIDDDIQEDDEHFRLLITSLTPRDPRILVSQTSATVTIVDDDIGKPIVENTFTV